MVGYHVLSVWWKIQSLIIYSVGLSGKETILTPANINWYKSPKGHFGKIYQNYKCIQIFYFWEFILRIYLQK